jgi:hypothetical protein
MPYERLAESVQVLYAELLDQTVHAEAESVAAALPHGSFVSKTIRGVPYWYLQVQEGERRRQRYLGRESPALRAWMEEAKESRARSAADAAGRARLVGMLAAGGAFRESAHAVRVLEILAAAGVFRMGGVLVGTQAFAAYGNLLGVRFSQQALRTQDVDTAQDRTIGIALAQESAPVEAAEALETSELGFSPVPQLDPRQPSTSFKIRGRELRVDFLTPMRGPESSVPVYLPALGVSAHPLRLLDYLIEPAVEAVVVGGSGVLVNVPDPARFALHKLWISGRRSVAEQSKAAKDLRQAGDLLELLLADRPGDLLLAWEALAARRGAAAAVRRAVERLGPEVRAALSALPGFSRVAGRARES